MLRKGNDVPIVMLAAKASESDRVAGLRLGADDYVVKPFSPRELVARVEAVLRRSGTARIDTFTGVASGGGRLASMASGGRCAWTGALVELTRSEFDLPVGLSAWPRRDRCRSKRVRASPRRSPIASATAQRVQTMLDNPIL